MVSASFLPGKHKFKLQQKLENLQHAMDSFTNYLLLEKVGGQAGIVFVY